MICGKGRAGEAPPPALFPETMTDSNARERNFPVGTRHLIAVVKDGKFKVAQYGQWDGYPNGQGVAILRFLRSADLAEFSRKVDLCRFGSDTEIEAAYAAYSTGGWMTLEQSNAFKASPFAYLSRDTGADILGVIMAADESLMLKDSSAFAADGLFCEWAYVIDLDKQSFEVYRGFYKTPAPDGERFAYLNGEVEKRDEKIGTYYPVHLAKTYPLGSLPSDADFTSELAALDEAELAKQYA